MTMKRRTSNGCYLGNFLPLTNPGPITFLTLLIPLTVLSLQNNTVILLSFDGFRWDYISKYNLSNFNYFANVGVRTEGLRPSFLTKTFPNHFTIVTGLYVESHGIIAGEMYDPVFNETFIPSNTDPKWWNKATPIWIANEFTSNSSRKNHKSAVVFWPGSNVEYNHHLPYFYMPMYNSSFPHHSRFGKIIELLGEHDPPNFIAGYFEEPDAVGHEYGPNSNEVSEELKRLDELLGIFLEKLREKDILDKVNIVMVSDHGMAEIKPTHQIVLDDYIDPSWRNDFDNFNDYNTYMLLNPKEEHKMKIYEKLKKVAHLTVYLKEEIPEKFHYKHNRRVTPIFLLAEEGWIITRKRMNLTHAIGNHGYPNNLESMHGIFLARGPAFKKGYTGKRISNIHIYSMLCHILGIEPLPNNGSLSAVMDFLMDEAGISVQNNNNFNSKTSAFEITLVIVIVTMVGVICLGLYLQFRGSVISAYSYRQVRTTSVYFDNLSREDVEFTGLPFAKNNNDLENQSENENAAFQN